MWSGVGPSWVGEAGAARCGMDKVRTRVSRGVWLDVARTEGAERLEGGYPISPNDLSAAEEDAGVDVSPGDVVLVRTGQIQVFKAGDRERYGSPSPGLSMATATWFRDRDVAAVATDNMTFEVWPGER